MSGSAHDDDCDCGTCCNARRTGRAEAIAEIVADLRKLAQRYQGSELPAHVAWRSAALDWARRYGRREHLKGGGS